MHNNSDQAWAWKQQNYLTGNWRQLIDHMCGVVDVDQLVDERLFSVVWMMKNANKHVV